MARSHQGRLIIGCGYLGRRIAQRWLREGYCVSGTTRTPDHAAELGRLGVEPIQCDVLASASLAALPAVHTVVHCVGLDRGAGQSMRSVYVDGLDNVLVHLPQAERFIYVSSSSVYGQCHGEEVDETAATAPLEESGQVVLAAEQLLWSRLPNAIVLRFGGIYGPGRLLRQKAVQAGEPIQADPDRWLNLIHVEDGASAVLAAEARAQSGAVYNICDDQPVRRREFLTLLAQLLDAPEPRFVSPLANASLPPHERSNRRISNRRMHAELAVQLAYPSFREGLRASCPTRPPA